MNKMKTVRVSIIGLFLCFSSLASAQQQNVNWVGRFEAMLDTMNNKVETASSEKWIEYKKQYNLLVAEFDAADKANLTMGDVRKIKMYKDSIKKLQVTRKTKRVSNGLKKGTKNAKSSIKGLFD